jgi:hypothetical protein
MPRNTINYSNTIIYKIVCKDLNINDCYVGHTTDFTKRKYQHKNSCNCLSSASYNDKKYIYIRQNGGWENWEMIEIEKYACCDRNEARARERYWYEQVNSKLNTRLPMREIEEKHEYNKNYLNDHKDELKEKRKDYEKKNRAIITEKANLYGREYSKRDDVKERSKIKITCECGSLFRKRDKAQHLKTNKHQEFINKTV